MGLMTGTFPPVDPATFREAPYRERLRSVVLFWVENGFGSPRIVHVIYITKLVLFYALGGVLVATLSSGLAPLDPAAWWDEPLVWQKLVLWTILLECIGVAGSWGPLAGHFKPMTAGFRHYGRTGTLRCPPWAKRLPFTKGEERTVFDVVLYLALLAAIVVAIVAPSVDAADLTAVVGPNEGLVAPAALIPIIALLVVLGLRDKVLFIAARSEQYIPALVFFAFFPFVDMIVAAKILIVTVWVGAAFSKFGRHFSSVVCAMVSNTPWVVFKGIKRLHYRDFPNDVLPSKRAVTLAHAAGTFIEMVTPLILIFSQDPTVTAVGVVVMLLFHTFIISTFPMAVPLEWNALFMYIAAFLFLGYPNHEGFGLGDMDPALLALTLVGTLLFPVLGNLRPDLVSFLPSMRQYAGNWPSALWAHAPGTEQKLNDCIKKAAPMTRDQLAEQYGEERAEVILHQVVGFRSMHSQGRGLNSLLINHLGNRIDDYHVREAEFSCNAVLGFNFGDGHFHDERLIEAIQKRCRFAPGEFIVAWVESEPFRNGRQQYKVIDAALGIVERGSWEVANAVAEQPWLPNGPIATDVTYRRAGYTMVRDLPQTPGTASPPTAPPVAESGPQERRTEPEVVA